MTVIETGDVYSDCDWDGEAMPGADGNSWLVGVSQVQWLVQMKHLVGRDDAGEAGDVVARDQISSGVTSISDRWLCRVSCVCALFGVSHQGSDFQALPVCLLMFRRLLASPSDCV